VEFPRVSGHVVRHHVRLPSQLSYAGSTRRSRLFNGLAAWASARPAGGHSTALASAAASSAGRAGCQRPAAVLTRT
jgi:hypothetical protein